MFDLGINRTPKAPTGPLTVKQAPPPPPPPQEPAAKPSADKRNGIQGAQAITHAASSELPPEPWDKTPAPPPPASPYAAQLAQVETPVATPVEGAPAGATEVYHTDGCDDPVTPEAPSGPVSADAAERAQLAKAQHLSETVDALPPEQRAQYDHVLASAQASGIPDAETALNNLVSSGRMTPEMLADFDGITQGPNCDRATQGQPENINRVVGELLRQVDNPTSIVQDPVYKTCSEASAEYKLASENPGQYVQMMRAMVSQNDMMTLPDGSQAGLAVFGLDNGDASGRSFASAMFQQTLHARFSDGMADGPIRAERMELMVNALFPGHADGGLTTFDQDQAATATAALQPGAIALIEVPGQQERHAVTVMSNENGKVTFFDSHAEGGIMTADAADFAAYLRGATLPPGTGVVDTHADFPVAGETNMTTTTTTRPAGTAPRPKPPAPTTSG